LNEAGTYWGSGPNHREADVARGKSYPFDSARMRIHRIILAVLACLFAFQGLKIVSNLPADLRGAGNYSPFYRTGVMLEAGERHNLYDPALQRDWAARVLPNDPKVRGDYLYFYHLPYQALFLLPFAFFSYRASLMVWMLAGVAATVWCAHVVSADFPELRRFSGVPLAFIFLAFWPVAETLPEGQDTLFLFMLLAFSFHEFVHKRDYSAGAILSLGLFKFQYTIPMTVILLFRKRPKFVVGAALMGLVVLLASWAVVGTDGMRQFIYVLLHHNTLPLANPESGWPNIRGLVEAFARSYSPVLTVVASIGVIAWCALGKMRDSAEEFAIALTAGVLVSYHMHEYDLVLLLLPAVVLLERAIRERNWVLAFFPLLLFFAPLEPVLKRLDLWYLYAIPAIAMIYLLRRSAIGRPETRQSQMEPSVS
jgi:Glycosyltransferase family 87